MLPQIYVTYKKYKLVLQTQTKLQTDSRIGLERDVSTVYSLLSSLYNSNKATDAIATIVNIYW